MHAFFVMGEALHAFAAAVLAFFILFAASRAEGFVRLLGNLLGWILLIGAAAGLVFGIYGAATGHHPPWMDHGYPSWMKHGNEEGETPSSSGAQQPQQQAPPPQTH